MRAKRRIVFPVALVETERMDPMSSSNSFLARARLRVSPLALRLARVPLLGGLLRKASHRLLPGGTTAWARIQAGPVRDAWILLDVRGGSDFLAGNREPAVQKVLGEWLAPGQVFYDVGANAGYFCLVASKRMNGSGKIFAFEAEPDVTFRLRSTLERNGLGEVTVVEKAVWSASGEVKFDRGLGSPDRLVGHVTSAGGADSADSIAVPAVSLDDFLRTAPPPDVLKCDVEGSEVEVFRGAANLLARHRPKVVCEVHSPENLETIQGLLRQSGYRTRLLEPEGRFPIHLVAETGS